MPPKPSPYPPPDFDPTHAYPELAPLQAAVVGRDWPAVRAFFAQLDDADAHIVAYGIASEVEGADAWLGEVVAVEPDSVLANGLLACSLIDVGWRVRTGKLAKYVSREQFATFHDYLRRAEQVLIDLIAREPDDVPAWTQRLKTARGLGLGQAEARRRYDHAARRDPHCLGAQIQLLQQLYPKWSGDFDKAHAFARECADAAPPGALNAALIAEYHLERWIAETNSGVKGYLRRPEVEREIHEAAARSVLHPDCRGGYRWFLAHNLFAMVFSMMGDYASAAVHFRAIGQFGNRTVWRTEDPAQLFIKYRDRALAKG